MTKEEVMLGFVYDNIKLKTWFKIVYMSELENGEPDLVGAKCLVDGHIMWKGNIKRFVRCFTGPIREKEDDGGNGGE